MKSSFAILLLSIYLITATQLNQLLKLPKLVEHYFEHKALNSNLSLSQFFSIHYTHGDVMDDDYEEDMKLPFKTQSICYTISILEKIPTIEFQVLIQEFEVQKSVSFYSHNFTTASNLDNIWRPPQLA